jgi:glycosyltransferase involved in cell wall biosynthesis
MDRYGPLFIEAINSHLRFHSQNVAASDQPELEKIEYLRHLLLMRIGFLEYSGLLAGRTLEDLLELLQWVEVKGDLVSTTPAKKLPLTILVKTFSRPKMIERFLTSVGEYQRAYHMLFSEIVVGDDSTRRLLEKNQLAISRVKEKYPELLIRHLKWETNIGISEGRNRLVEAAQSENILLCDDDFIFDQTCDFEDVIDVFNTQGPDILGGWLKNNYDLESGGYDYWGSHGKIIDLPDEMVVEVSESSSDCPDYVETDFLLNFFIAKRDSLLQLKWDPELKIEEHYEFFLGLARSDYRAGFSNLLFVKNTREKMRNPVDDNQPRFDEETWREAFFRSIGRLGKKRRSVYRWRDDHYVLWYTDFVEKKGRRRLKKMLRRIVNSHYISPAMQARLKKKGKQAVALAKSMSTD